MSDPRFTRRIPSAHAEPRRPETFEVEDDEVLDVASALGSDARWTMVRALADDTMTIQELTDEVGLSKGTVSVHIQQLEEAEIVGSRFNVSDSGGVEKEVGLLVDEVTLKLSDL